MGTCHALKPDAKQFCSSSASRHLLGPSARPRPPALSRSPALSPFCMIPIALISHLFHSCYKGRLKWQGLLGSLFLSRVSRPITDRYKRQEGGKKEKYEDFEQLICNQCLRGSDLSGLDLGLRNPFKLIIISAYVGSNIHSPSNPLKPHTFLKGREKPFNFSFLEVE